MVKRFVAITLLAAAFPCLAKAARDPICTPLKTFVASVKPKETRKLAFQTSWGKGFKDTTDPTFAAKRCVHDGYAPAKAACDAWLEDGQAEFPGNNALRAIACLLPGVSFGHRHVDLKNIELATSYGTDGRGSLVTIRLAEDEQLGGVVLEIEAVGY